MYGLTNVYMECMISIRDELRPRCLSRCLDSTLRHDPEFGFSVYLMTHAQFRRTSLLGSNLN
jgi:hypothetical protein